MLNMCIYIHSTVKEYFYSLQSLVIIIIHRLQHYTLISLIISTIIFIINGNIYYTIGILHYKDIFGNHDLGCYLYVDSSYNKANISI